MIPTRKFPAPLAALLLAVGLPAGAWGWGGPHATITLAALRTLPGWQQELLGAELPQLGQRYCLIPDTVFTDKPNARFATMDSHPGEVYLVSLHLPASQAENYGQLGYFLEKTVSALRAGQVGDAARYAGTLTHMLEDFGCPAHAVPGDNMFTLFKQLLPPPPAHEYTLLHSPIESGSFPVNTDGYRPRLLGTSVNEAAFGLLQRVQAAILNARRQVIPIIQGLYAGDTNAVTAAQQQAATFDATVVADALYTALCLGTQRTDPQDRALPATIDVAALIPLECTNLFCPQSAFFSKPYWGYARSGVVLEGGTNAVPLRLNVTESGRTVQKQFRAGIGTGTRSVLTYLVPANVYRRFETLAGLQAGLGAHGRVVFEVFGNGAPLARVGPLAGDAPAQPICVPLAGVTNLQLITTSGGGAGTGNYALWAEPQLVK